jgi:hypothetical protein
VEVDSEGDEEFQEDDADMEPKENDGAGAELPLPMGEEGSASQAPEAAALMLQQMQPQPTLAQPLADSSESHHEDAPAAKSLKTMAGSAHEHRSAQQSG